MLFSFVIAIQSTAELFDAIPEYAETIDKKMPNFEIVHGTFKSNEDFSYELSKKIFVSYRSGDDDTKSSEIISETNRKYDTYLVIKEKSIDVYIKDASNNVSKFGQLIFSEFNDITKSTFISYWKEFAESYLTRLGILTIFTVMIFIVYGIYRVWTLIFYCFSVFFINVIFMNKFKHRDYLKIAIYVSTLPILLEMIAFIISQNLPEAANFINMIIALIYTYYALKAIKLDSILLTAVGDTPEEKIRNAITQAQEELQRQLDELEAKEEERRREKEENASEIAEKETKEEKSEDEKDNKN